jgi:hypothetical protein
MMASRDWADAASVWRAGSAKATEYRTVTGNISSGLDLILQVMADRCDELADDRAGEEYAARQKGEL